jgi:hypothetical protein
MITTWARTRLPPPLNTGRWIFSPIKRLQKILNQYLRIKDNRKGERAAWKYRSREVWEERSGVRSQESGVRNQESGVRNQESGVRSQESGVRMERVLAVTAGVFFNSL